MVYKIDPEFAESGEMDKDSVFDALAGNGTVDKVLRYKFFNKAINRGDVAINQIFDNMPPAVPRDDRSDAVGLNVYSSGSCFASLMDSINHIDVGSEIVGVYPTTISGVPKVLAIPYSGDDVVVIDPDTMTVEETVDLSGGLASATWSPIGVVADGTNAYFVFETSTYSRVIQAFRMSDWTVTTGWPANGTSLPNGSGFIYPISVCNADSSFVAVLTNYYAGGGASTLLELYDKSDGTLSDSGDGDASPSGTLYPQGLASNGTYLFFRDGDGHLCSAEIADLSNGCGWANGPLTVTGGGLIGSVACAGGLVVTRGAGDTDPFIYVAHESNALICAITTDDDTLVKGIYAVGFDGESFWGVGYADVGITSRTFLFKLKIERCLNEDGTTAQAISGSSGIVDPYGIAIDGDCGAKAVLISDGRDMWFPNGNSSDFDDRIFRFPLTHFR